MDDSHPSSEQPTPRQHNFYGRRRGRKLRPKQTEYLDQGLAQFGLDLDLPERHTANLDPATLFDHPPRHVFLEIGFGGGEHLATRASQNPQDAYIGAEPFINGVASLCRHLSKNAIKNTLIWPEDVRLLLPAFTPQSLQGVFILFPDPWPKHRHRQRRILQPPMLDELRRIIKPHGTVLLASDEPRAKTWLLAQMMRRSDFLWMAKDSHDWRTPPNPSLHTRYKAKAEKQGRQASWFLFKRLP